MLCFDEITLSIVFDNDVCHDGCQGLWGFACVVEMPSHTLLFDTGSNGRVLLRNLRAMDIDLTQAKTLFLSHPHWDHMGGIDSITELYPNLHCIFPSSLSKRFCRDMGYFSAKLSVADEAPCALGDDLYASGIMEEIGEQALWIDTNRGIVILTGCAHAGVVAIVERAKAFFNKEVYLLLGGFHLSEASNEAIVTCVDAIRSLGVRYVCPTHCSGERAQRAFAKAFGRYALRGDVGRVLYLKDLGE